MSSTKKRKYNYDYIKYGFVTINKNAPKKKTDDFKRYFPDSCDNTICRLATDPFHVDIDMLPDTLQEQALKIKNDSAAQYDFEKMEKAQFWVKYLKVYPSTAEQALKFKLDIASDLRCALSSIEPRIGNLLKNMQVHPTH
ncbi:unnamed protein product [Euphydryas editha]|uniref:Uncharacterized protein n=1 Tax=Euphydryas editha TaxID=104508 RepID=A0AAU9UDF3_EUPED|nr:unnamed protein product [Euphydryas editha]